MKKTSIIIGVLFLFSCQLTWQTNVDSVKNDIVYFKDERTGLCFAAINSSSGSSGREVVSITCVPCDSLKNIQIK